MADIFKEELTEAIKKHIDDNLMLAKKQPADSHKFSGLENETLFGVPKQSK